MKKFLLILLPLFLFQQACLEFSDTPDIASGPWRAVLHNGGGDLPFNVRVDQDSSGSYIFHILNGDEDIIVDEIEIDSDSVFIKLPVFDSEWRLEMVDENLLQGTWIKYSQYKPVSMPIRLDYGSRKRFMRPNMGSSVDLSGSWRTVFSPDNPADRYEAIGRFNQTGTKLSGTFLTSTGDYRYLQGEVDADSMFLSCFDGSHAFLFKAKYQNDTLYGRFWSGASWEEPWIAVPDSNYSLPNADSLTFLKSDYDSIDFVLPDLDSNLHSLSDSAFIGKVLVIQIMGTWCPNCMDETAFLSDYYNTHQDDNLEFIGLAFERTNHFNQAVSNVKRLIKRFDIRYPILLAGFPSHERIAEVLPMIDRFMSYPTSIYIDKQGQIRRIHTGFSGPATGKNYEKFKADFDKFIQLLLNEQPES